VVEHESSVHIVDVLQHLKEVHVLLKTDALHCTMADLLHMIVQQQNAESNLESIQGKTAEHYRNLQNIHRPLFVQVKVQQLLQCVCLSVYAFGQQRLNQMTSDLNIRNSVSTDIRSSLKVKDVRHS